MRQGGSQEDNLGKEWVEKSTGEEDAQSRWEIYEFGTPLGFGQAFFLAWQGVAQSPLNFCSLGQIRLSPKRSPTSTIYLEITRCDLLCSSW
jgi:hypothetical protein